MAELAEQGVESITVEAVITRADGTTEDLGAVAEWHATDEDPAIEVVGPRYAFIEFVKEALNGPSSH